MIHRFYDSIFRDRKTTWLTRSFRWVKRFLGYDRDALFTKNLKLVIKEMEEVFKRRNTYIRSKGSFLREKYSIDTFKWNLVINDVSDKELLCFIRLRMFSVAWTNMLVVNLGLGVAIKNKCICCLENVRENMEHFLIDCNAFIEVRRNFSGLLSQLKDKSNSNKILFISVILGNKSDLFSADLYINNLVLSIKFCKQMMMKRVLLINEYIREDRSRCGIG